MAKIQKGDKSGRPQTNGVVSKNKMIVYRYIDKSTNIIKYIGIVYGKNRTLRQRVYEHKKHDEWVSDVEWKIEYIYNPNGTRTDAEHLEAHLIALYKTYNWYNKAKRDWGISNYLPKEFNWQVYKEKKFKQRDTTKQEKKLQKLRALTKSYQEEKKYTNLALGIKKCLLENNFKQCCVRDYVRVRLHINLEDAVKLKEYMFKDIGKTKYNNLVADIIDVSKSSDYDGFNNVEFVVYKGITKNIDDSVGQLYRFKEIYLKRVRETFKDDSEYNKYIAQETV